MCCSFRFPGRLLLVAKGRRGDGPKARKVGLFIGLRHLDVTLLLHWVLGCNYGHELGVSRLLGRHPLSRGALDFNLAALAFLGHCLGRLLQQVDGAALLLYTHRQVRPQGKTEEVRPGLGGSCENALPEA